jgi:hypothetical protein
MGLIRKSLAVGSVGVIRGSSKKQRVAKATMRSSAAAAQAAAVTAAAASAAAQLAEQQASEEREFRYATDAVYRKFIDDKRAAEQAQGVAEAARLAETLRIKRERNRARRASASHAARVMAMGLAIFVVSVVVWVPQLAVARIRHREANLWLRTRLRAS